MKGIIATLTKDCPRQDCEISLLGFTQTYDKQGNPTHRDPNTTTSNFTCATCGDRWKVRSRDGAPAEVIREAATGIIAKEKKD